MTGTSLSAYGPKVVPAPVDPAVAVPVLGMVERSEVMFVIREVVTCKPGKVRQMVEKFRGISTTMQEMGQEPLTVLTDVAGGPFWTIVAEATVERIEDFFAMEQRLMANETLRKTMADYHDLVDQGRREIYRVEARSQARQLEKS